MRLSCYVLFPNSSYPTPLITDLKALRFSTAEANSIKKVLKTFDFELLQKMSDLVSISYQLMNLVQIRMKNI